MCLIIINLKKERHKCLIPIPSDGGSSKFGNVEAKMTFIENLVFFIGIMFFQLFEFLLLHVCLELPIPTHVMK